MFTLSNILKVNAISSGATGLLLTFFSAFFARLFGVNTTIPFVFIGLFLVVFSLFVLFQAYQRPLKPKQIVWVIWMDRAWVVASIVTVPMVYNSISFIGASIILAIAAWVGLMAYMQNAKLIRV